MRLAMKFGLFYLFSKFGDISQERVFSEVLEEIDYGEELGFDSVWLPEHHFSVYGTLGNPMTFAAARPPAFGYRSGLPSP
jgi:alkanesulfonate monooxygenase SsuD/methylene tetrahydromethanopterin reductase-like flavin-dependent oxidoreductase (luciferase family)